MSHISWNLIIQEQSMTGKGNGQLSPVRPSLNLEIVGHDITVDTVNLGHH